MKEQAAKPFDRQVDGTVAAFVVDAPYAFDQLLPLEDAVGVFGEEKQQGQIAGRDGQSGAVQKTLRDRLSIRRLPKTN